MDEETRAELAALRSEIDALRMEMAEAGREMAGGEGADVGLPLVPIGGGDALPGAFEPVYADGVLSGLKNCIYCAERQFVECGEVDSDGVLAISGVTASTSGYVVLTLTHSSSSEASDIIASEAVAVESALPTNANEAVTKIALYHVTGGVVDVDLRAVPTAVLAR